MSNVELPPNRLVNELPLSPGSVKLPSPLKSISTFTCVPSGSDAGLVAVTLTRGVRSTVKGTNVSSDTTGGVSSRWMIRSASMGERIVSPLVS